MKSISLILASGVFISSFANAEVIASCRKRSPYAYGTFYWTQIERSGNQLLFTDAVGDESQISEIYFESPIEQTADQQFHYQGSDYELSVELAKKKLSFTLKAGGKTVRKKNYECVSVTP